MIVLDENVIAKDGLQDADILPFLQRLSRPTIFSLDIGFYSRHFCHPRYGLAVLSVEAHDVASYVRRVLGHPRFSRARDRMGRVINAFQAGLRSWKMHPPSRRSTSGCRSPRRWRTGSRRRVRAARRQRV